MTDRQTSDGRMPAAERRDQLLDIAAALLLGEGYQSVSIDRVSREAGIARTVIYSQFENLDGMHGALRDRNRARITEQVMAVMPEIAAAGTDDVDAMTVDAFDAFLDVIVADPVTWRLALLPPDGAPAALRDRVTDDRAAIIVLLTPLCSTGLERRGGPAGLEPELLARQVRLSRKRSAVLWSLRSVPPAASDPPPRQTTDLTVRHRTPSTCLLRLA